MKITKSQYRNKMTCSTLTMLMTVQLHSQDIQHYNPDPAIHHWNEHHHRCLTFMDKKRMRGTQPAEAYDLILSGSGSASGSVKAVENETVESDDSFTLSDLEIDSDIEES